MDSQQVFRSSRREVLGFRSWGEGDGVCGTGLSVRGTRVRRGLGFRLKD